ncbi:MAG: insulinase family protein [Bdellovibrionaceae bacterium]|nr:insulinase family protein [Bdellovibrionales bacterium]MCB9085800.1 insulinase family protein [Pseudobdellovibrionaceae bacterium]
MKIRILTLVSLVLLIAGCATLPGGGGFKLRSYKEATLKNGMKVLMVEDKSLPYFSLAMLVRAGSSEDPQAASGTASMVGELLDKGTAKRKALELADAMGQIGSELSVSVGQDYTLISASTLAQHQGELLKNFSEMVTEPSFSGSEVNRVKKQVLSQLQRTVDDPGHFAGLMFDSYLYGSHPYARRVLGRKRDVTKLRKKDIIKYYLKHYRPNNAQLAVVGHFNPTIVEDLEKAFAEWSSRKQTDFTYPEVPAITGLQIQIIDKTDLKQSEIRLGHPGIKRTNPDFLKLRVANTILGGAFHSRLVDEIRDRRGLTYSIRSEFDARKDTGPFTVATFTRHEKVGETVSETLKVIQDFQNKGVTDKEVADAKALLLGVFPRALETAERLAETMLVLRFYQVPDTYLTNYLRDISKIKTSEVNDVIKKYLQPDNMKVLVFSPKDKVISQLRPIGIVQVKNYTEYIQ